MGDPGIRRSSAAVGVSDEGEFQRFVKACLPKLLRSAYALQGDLDSAEDLVQATLLRVFRHWDAAREAPEGYAYATLVNICRDGWRRHQSRPQPLALSDSDLLGGSVSPSEDWERHEALAHALDQLPDQQHAVLMLRFLFDLSTAETARVLQIPEGTVKSTTHRGLERLRELLAPATEEVQHVDR